MLLLVFCSLHPLLFFLVYIFLVFLHKRELGLCCHGDFLEMFYVLISNRFYLLMFLHNRRIPLCVLLYGKVHFLGLLLRLLFFCFFFFVLMSICMGFYMCGVYELYFFIYKSFVHCLA